MRKIFLCGGGGWRVVVVLVKEKEEVEMSGKFRGFWIGVVWFGEMSG